MLASLHYGSVRSARIGTLSVWQSPCFSDQARGAVFLQACLSSGYKQANTLFGLDWQGGCGWHASNLLELAFEGPFSEQLLANHMFDEACGLPLSGKSAL
jgi:hypothetical protein